MTHAGAVPGNIPSANYEGSPVWSRPFLFTGNFCDCGGHGHCESVPDVANNVNKSICVCEPGWTGFGDFVDARGASCHISVDAVRYLWVANLVLWAISLLLVSFKLKDLFKKHRESKEKLRRKGKKYYVWHNQGLFSVVLALTVAMPGLAATGIIKLAVPGARVAFDGLVTFFWFYGRVGIGLATSIHQPALMKQMLRAQSSADQVIREYDRYGKILAFSQAAAALWAIPVLATQGRNIPLSRACFALFCLQVSLGFFLLMFQARTLRKALYRILTDSAAAANKQVLLILRDKLCEGQVKIQKQTGFQALVYLTFAVAPPLWMTYEYMLPISWFTPPILLYNVVTAIHDEKTKDTSSPPPTIKSSRKTADAAMEAEESRKPFEIPESAKFDDGKSSYYGAETAVVVQDAEDEILTATGQTFTRLNVLKNIKEFAGVKEKRSQETSSQAQKSPQISNANQE